MLRTSWHLAALVVELRREVDPTFISHHAATHLNIRLRAHGEAWSTLREAVVGEHHHDQEHLIVATAAIGG